MGTISIVFRVPVYDRTLRILKSLGDHHPGPYACYRLRDDGPNRRETCKHKHIKHTAATKCARSMSMGETFGAVNERVEIRCIKDVEAEDKTEVLKLVSEFFGGDMATTSLWMRAPNPMLGEISAEDYAALKGCDKLLERVRVALDENKRG